MFYDVAKQGFLTRAPPFCGSASGGATDGSREKPLFSGGSTAGVVVHENPVTCPILWGVITAQAVPITATGA